MLVSLAAGGPFVGKGTAYPQANMAAALLLNVTCVVTSCRPPECSVIVLCAHGAAVKHSCETQL